MGPIFYYCTNFSLKTGSSSELWRNRNFLFSYFLPLIYSGINNLASN